MNPYHYGTPVQGAQFTGRAEEIDALVNRMRNRISVVIISPRRYGKTSLIHRATGVVRGEGAAVTQVNVLRCRDAATFAGALAGSTFRVPGGRWHRFRNAIGDFLKRLRVAPSVTFGPDGRPTFSFVPGLAPRDVDALVADVYAVLAEIALDRPAVLVLDEFQAVTDLGARLPSLFKALADEHPGVSLVLAGSKRHLMERLVVEPDAALYKMTEQLSLGPLPPRVMTRFLRRRARAGGKRLDAPVATHIAEAGGPVPNDIQRLAYEAYDAAGDVIDVAAVDRGMDLAVAHGAGLYAERYELLSPGQRRVVSELARSITAEPYGAAFVARVGLANAASVRKALTALVDAELARPDHGAWAVADPFFAGWLRRGG